jgi:hypothetical protein
MTDYRDAHQGRVNTVIGNFVLDDGTSIELDNISFDPYNNPTVAVDTSARFATHEIIGGTTVRQKIGEDPREIEISGVCTEETAQEVSLLHKVALCDLYHYKLVEIITCQVASTSTDPLEDGGAVDADTGEFLYEFNINLVEV